MSSYTTGEMAKLCGISVRAVQFYDTKDLLKPTALTEGGRRLYSDEDVKRLRLICMLKSLGMALGTIKDLLDSEDSGKVLLLLLETQAKELEAEIKVRQRQIKAIDALKDMAGSADAIGVDSFSDIEDIMRSKRKLRKTHMALLAIGLLMDLIEVGTVILWITRGIWIPFAIGMPFVILLGILAVRMYYKNTMYICAQCNGVFRPKFWRFLFAGHTPKTRKLPCPVCGHTGYCVEIASQDGPMDEGAKLPV